MARKNVPQIKRLKGKRKIVMLTAYDAPSARLTDEVADIILVGDSVGTAVQGNDNTIPVTMDQMIYHTKMVTNNSAKALVVGDMPFMSYQISTEDALRNAGHFLKEGRAQAVKLEGGMRSLAAAEAIAGADIPVMGHIGYTPQSEHAVGNKKVRREMASLMDDARRLEDAGVFAIVLECVVNDVAQEISEALSIPTIGIGAGRDCDGQVLVFHDLLGFDPNFKPTFVKKYFDFHSAAAKALQAYRNEVVNESFPDEEHSYQQKPESSLEQPK